MRFGLRIVSLLAVTSVLLFGFLLLQFRQQTARPDGLFSEDCPLDDGHWIGRKIRHAEIRAASLLDSQNTDLKAAAAAYRERRGRHPPPGFDAWYEWGTKRKRVLIEQFFDQIHEDLEPYWAIDPESIRTSVASWPSDLIRIRNGKVIAEDRKRFRTRTWVKMLKEISKFLPDLDMAINPLDEPRILASGDLDAKLRKEAAEKKANMMSLPVSEISGSLRRLQSDQRSPARAALNIANVKSYHKALKASCPRQSELSNLDENNDKTEAVKDICTNPRLLSQHGFLLEPATISFSKDMIPVFSATKLSVNNDILLPEPAYYYDEFSLFSSGGFWTRFKGGIPWKHKKHGLMWRGSATGGIPRADTWAQYHRHRFVMALNSSIHSELEPHISSPEWLHAASDVAFTGLSCDSRRNGEDCCASLSSNFRLADRRQMHEQYKYKYLPDIDGNSLSGRFRVFMLSGSAPIKATIFKEWHGGRLVPWKHFIPLGMGFEEIYDVMAYFLGSENGCAHDEDGELIAISGQKWAESVLQKDDMLHYMWLVLLEYARVMDDERERLGYVGDLSGRK